MSHFNLSKKTAQKREDDESSQLTFWRSSWERQRTQCSWTWYRQPIIFLWLAEHYHAWQYFPTISS